MTGRALTLLCIGVAMAVILSGCHCMGYDPDDSTGELLLETDVDLYAVVRPNAYEGYIGAAVGAGGTVIAWGVSYNPFLRVQVGENDLRGLHVESSTWWVVGDAGTLAVSLDDGGTWTPVNLGITANLRGITRAGSRMVVVGDGVVLLQGGDGIWAEVLPPDGGWGDLRAVHYDRSRVYAVGLAGKAWSAPDPGGEWVAEDIGTEVDLFDVGSFQYWVDDPIQIAIVGAAGTMLLSGDNGWTRADTHVNADLISYDKGAVLAAGGGLYEIGEKRRLRHIDTLDGGLALTYEFYTVGAIVVGADGAAYTRQFSFCDGREDP